MSKRDRKIKNLVENLDISSLQNAKVVAFQNLGYKNSIFGMGYAIHYIPIWEMPRSEKQAKKYVARKMRKNGYKAVKNGN